MTFEPLKLTQYHDTVWTVIVVNEITTFAFSFCTESKAKAFYENIKENPDTHPTLKEVYLKSSILH